MTDSDTPSQERDGQADESQPDTTDAVETAASTDTVETTNPTDTVETTNPTDTVDTSAGDDSHEDLQVAAAFEEADAALTAAAEAHDDYREAITDAVVALDEVARLDGRDVPDETAAGDEFAGIDTEELDAAAAPEYTDGTGHLELYHAGQVVVRAARTLKRSRQFPQERAMALVQTTARASIHLCHEDVPDDDLADVATEAIEGVGDLAALARDDDCPQEAVAEAATELFEILSKVEEVRAATRARAKGDE